MAAAALFVRPIRIVGADSMRLEGIREYLPPGNVAQELWGAPITLAFLSWNHFEATAPIERDLPKGDKSAKIKAERK